MATNDQIKAEIVKLIADKGYVVFSVLTVTNMWQCTFEEELRACGLRVLHATFERFQNPNNTGCLCAVPTTSPLASCASTLRRCLRSPRSRKGS